MVAGIIFLVGMLAMWVGISGRGESFWNAITSASQ